MVVSRGGKIWVVLGGGDGLSPHVHLVTDCSDVAHNRSSDQWGRAARQQTVDLYRCGAG